MPAAALKQVVERVRRFPPGSALVFDYRLPREALPAEEQKQFDSLQTRATAKGEPFLSGWTPEAMRRELDGFAQMEDWGQAELNARCFAGRADGLAIRGEAGRLVWAAL